MLEKNGQMLDIPCSETIGTLCDLEKEPVLHLRGVCQDVDLDLDYNMKGEGGGMSIWGWSKTRLVWNEPKWSFFELVKGPNKVF